MSYVARGGRPRKTPRGFVRRGLGADMVKVAEMSNMTKTSATAAVPYATSNMTKSASAAIPYTTPTTWAKDSVVTTQPSIVARAPTPTIEPSLLDTFIPKPVPTLSVGPAPILAVAPPTSLLSPTPSISTNQWAKDSVVTTQPSVVARTPTPTIETFTPPPSRPIAPSSQKLYQSQPTTYASPDYVAPPVTTSDGPRNPVNIQPVSIIQPVLVPWADNTYGGGGGGGFRYPEEIPQGLEPTPIVITRPFPWWLVALGVGAYLYMKKK